MALLNVADDTTSSSLSHDELVALRRTFSECLKLRRTCRKHDTNTSRYVEVTLNMFNSCYYNNNDVLVMETHVHELLLSILNVLHRTPCMFVESSMDVIHELFLFVIEEEFLRAHKKNCSDLKMASNSITSHNASIDHEKTRTLTASDTIVSTFTISSCIKVANVIQDCQNRLISLVTNHGSCLPAGCYRDDCERNQSSLDAECSAICPPSLCLSSCSVCSTNDWWRSTCIDWNIDLLESVRANVVKYVQQNQMSLLESRQRQVGSLALSSAVLCGDTTAGRGSSHSSSKSATSLKSCRRQTPTESIEAIARVCAEICTCTAAKFLLRFLLACCRLLSCGCLSCGARNVVRGGGHHGVWTELVAKCLTVNKNGDNSPLNGCLLVCLVIEASIYCGRGLVSCDERGEELVEMCECDWRMIVYALVERVFDWFVSKYVVCIKSKCLTIREYDSFRLDPGRQDLDSVLYVIFCYAKFWPNIVRRCLTDLLQIFLSSSTNNSLFSSSALTGSESKSNQPAILLFLLEIGIFFAEFNVSLLENVSLNSTFLKLITACVQLTDTTSQPSNICGLPCIHFINYFTSLLLCYAFSLAPAVLVQFLLSVITLTSEPSLSLPCRSYLTDILERFINRLEHIHFDCRPTMTANRSDNFLFVTCSVIWRQSCRRTCLRTMAAHVHQVIDLSRGSTSTVDQRALSLSRRCVCLLVRLLRLCLCTQYGRVCDGLAQISRDILCEPDRELSGHHIVLAVFVYALEMLGAYTSINAADQSCSLLSSLFNLIGVGEVSRDLCNYLVGWHDMIGLFSFNNLRLNLSTELKREVSTGSIVANLAHFLSTINDNHFNYIDSSFGSQFDTNRIERVLIVINRLGLLASSSIAQQILLTEILVFDLLPRFILVQNCTLMYLIQNFLVTLSSQNSVCQSAILDFLLQSVLHTSAHDFGCAQNNGEGDFETIVSLLDCNWNRAHTSRISYNQGFISHSKNSHSRNMKRICLSTNDNRARIKSDQSALVSQKALADSYLHVLCACLQSRRGEDMLSLRLVDLISADPIFNGLPWNEWHMNKMTVERDLHVMRWFRACPILWSVLEILARRESPAFCFCSALVRALMTNVIQYWSNCQTRLSVQSLNMEKTSCKLVRLLCVGRYIPHQFLLTVQIIPHVTAFEIYILLMDIWNFVKDHVPSPSSFNSHPSVDCLKSTRTFGHEFDLRYRRNIMLIVQNSIHKLGFLVPQIRTLCFSDNIL